jgi:hypothetical protein
MMQPRTNSSRSRNKISFTKIPLWGIGLIVAVLLLSWAFNTFSSKPAPLDNAPLMRDQAVAQAQRAVREKVGDSLSISFPTAPEVEVSKATYTVRSLFVTTDRRGERHKRPWAVLLEFKGGEAIDSTNWKVVSCDIGQ